MPSALWGELSPLPGENGKGFPPSGGSVGLPRWLPESGVPRLVVIGLVYVLLTCGAVVAGFGMKSYSLAHISSFDTQDFVVLSPARIPSERLEMIAGIVLSNPEVEITLQSHGYGEGGKFLIHVVPAAWNLPHLPLEARASEKRRWPKDFDPDALKILVTRVASLDPAVEGIEYRQGGRKARPHSSGEVGDGGGKSRFAVEASADLGPGGETLPLRPSDLVFQQAPQAFRLELAPSSRQDNRLGSVRPSDGQGSRHNRNPDMEHESLGPGQPRVSMTPSGGKKSSVNGPGWSRCSGSVNFGMTPGKGPPEV